MTTLTVTAPFDGSEIATLHVSSEQEALNMLSVATELFANRDEWLPVHERIDILERLVNLMDSERSELAINAAREGGKPLIDSTVEVDRAIQGVKIAIATLRTRRASEIPMGITSSTANRVAYTYHEPVGVVFAISAFNHPLNLIVHQVVPAVACGCPVIVKPASSTPLSCLRMVQLIHEAGLPKQWCQALITRSNVAELLVSDPRISFFSFIGSGTVGWYLKSKLAPGASCALEHGGAAPVIVEADADLERAIPLLTKGGFYHAGQVCVSVQRIFAHQKIAKTLAKRIADSAKALVTGDPTLSTTQVGPLISPKEVNRIHEWVGQAVYHGGKLMCGGNKISDTCYEPTVILDPPHNVELSKNEIFGPVVCIYSYKDRRDAIDSANSLPFCFQASVFSKDIDVIADTVKRLTATTVMVNDNTAFRADWMPFGGRKHSGQGLGGIPYSMQELSYEKQWIYNMSPV